MDMDTDALGDLAVGDALRMRFPGYGVFTGKVVAFEGNKVDVHWNEDGSSTLLTPAQALKARVSRAEPKRSPKKKKADFEFGADEDESGSEDDVPGMRPAWRNRLSHRDATGFVTMRLDSSCGQGG